MKKQVTYIFMFLIAFSGAAFADREVEVYSESIGMFKKNETVAPYFGSAFGYAVFPTIAKGGLGIGASHGKGQVYRGGSVTGFTAATTITIGFQAGGPAFSQVIFLKIKILTTISSVVTSSLMRRLPPLRSRPAHRPAAARRVPVPVQVRAAAQVSRQKHPIARVCSYLRSPRAA